jgi:microcompartment protein CcmL/EutN
MSGLQHDSEGFLTGGIAKVDKGAISRLLSVMSSVKGDVTAIRKALEGGVASPKRSGNANASPSIRKIAGQSPTAFAGAQRDAKGRFVSGSSRQSPNSAADSLATKQQAAVVSASSRLAKAIEREKDGRFKSKDGESNNDGGGEKAGFWSRLKDSFSGLGGDGIDASGVGDAAAQIDPAAAAAGEVASAVAPIARMGGGLFRFFKGDKQEKAEEKVAKKVHVPWYKKLLKASNDNAGDAGGGGGQQQPSMLSGIMSSIGGMVLPALAVAGAAMLGTSIGTWIYEKFAPQIATAIDGTVEFAKKSWDAVKTKWDEIAGGWTALTDDIGKAWTSITDAIGEKFDIVKDAVVETYDQARDVASRGIETVIEGTKAAYNTARDGASRGIETVVEGGKSVYNKSVDATSRGIEATANAAASAKDWVLGKTSSVFESGKSGAATVSTGRGDHGGASYGTYQLSSSQGTLKKFLNSSKYGEQFQGLTPGSKEFNDKWKSIAASDDQFGNAQHDFIQNTHYKPQMEKLAASGIDLSKRGSAVQDAVWSTSVQFGGKTGLIEKALGGKDVSKMSDTDIANAIQDYKIANNDKLFSSSSANVRAGTMNRAVKEKAALAALSQAPTVAQTESLPSAAPSTANQVIPPPPPPMIASNATDKGKAPQAPQLIPDNMITQNLSDRSAAQVVTGGIGFQGSRA